MKPDKESSSSDYEPSEEIFQLPDSESLVFEELVLDVSESDELLELAERRLAPPAPALDLSVKIRKFNIQL